jgi:hypothetical protein
MASFVSQTITLRYKTFSEVWAELGGAWAATAVVIGVFFKKRIAKHPEGVQESVQVFRFRSPANQRNEIKSFVKDVAAFKAPF